MWTHTYGRATCPCGPASTLLNFMFLYPCAVCAWEPVLSASPDQVLILVLPVPNKKASTEKEEQTVHLACQQHVLERLALWKLDASPGTQAPSDTSLWSCNLQDPLQPKPKLANMLRGFSHTASTRLEQGSGGYGLEDEPVPPCTDESEAAMIAVQHFERHTKTTALSGPVDNLRHFLCGVQQPGCQAMSVASADDTFPSRRSRGAPGGVAAGAFAEVEKHSLQEQQRKDGPVEYLSNIPPHQYLFYVRHDAQVACEKASADPGRLQVSMDGMLPGAADSSFQYLMGSHGGEACLLRMPGAPSQAQAKPSRAWTPGCPQIPGSPARDAGPGVVLTAARIAVDVDETAPFSQDFVTAVQKLQGHLHDKLWDRPGLIAARCLEDLPTPTLLVHRFFPLPVPDASGLAVDAELQADLSGDSEAEQDAAGQQHRRQAKSHAKQRAGDNTAENGVLGRNTVLARGRAREPPETTSHDEANVRTTRSAATLAGPAARSTRSTDSGGRTRTPHDGGDRKAKGESGPRQRYCPTIGGGQVGTQPLCHSAWPPGLCAEENLLRNMVVERDPFVVLILGDKRVEYRQYTEYWQQRLMENGQCKHFTHVHIALGMSKARPQFVAVCKGVTWVPAPGLLQYASTGYSVDLSFVEGYFAIALGDVVWCSGALELGALKWSRAACTTCPDVRCRCQWLYDDSVGEEGRG